MDYSLDEPFLGTSGVCRRLSRLPDAGSRARDTDSGDTELSKEVWTFREFEVLGSEALFRNDSMKCCMAAV